MRAGRSTDEASYVWRGATLAELRAPRAFAFSYDEAGTLAWIVPSEGEPIAVWSPSDGAYRGPLAPGCTYEPSGRPRAVGPAALHHDAAGRRQVRTAPGHVTRYAYDALNRLVRVEEPARTIEHAHDALGRRLRTTVTAIPPAPRAPEEDGASEPPPPPPAREGSLEYVWDGLELLHRRGDYAPPVTFVRADGLLVALRAEGAWWIVLPDPGGAVDALMTTGGDVCWRRRADTLAFGAVDEPVERLGIPAVPGHVWDPASGFWHSITGDLDPETARYLVPSPFGLGSGPWRYAGPPDPVRPPPAPVPRAPRPPYDEIGLQGFDALWLREVVSALSCERDDAAAHAWLASHDESPPDPTAWMLA